MNLNHYLLKAFDDRSEVNSILVPEGSILLKAAILHEGVYVFYATPHLDTGSRTDQFVTVKTGNQIPLNSTFIDVLSVIVEEQGQQGVLVISLFKINKQHGE